MTISSDGILYFGFLVGEDEEPPEWLGEDDEGNPKDFDDFVCELANLSEDTKYEERHRMIDNCPAELQMYCSYDYPMYVLGVRGCEYRVNRGFTKILTADMLIIDRAKIEKFEEWCKQNKIEYKEPRWYLCSMYG
jgi:hypothetical protein